MRHTMKTAISDAFETVRSNYPDSVRLRLEILKLEKEMKELYEFNGLKNISKVISESDDE